MDGMDDGIHGQESVHLHAFMFRVNDAGLTAL
jgi:hypothetical protein